MAPEVAGSSPVIHPNSKITNKTACFCAVAPRKLTDSQLDREADVGVLVRREIVEDDDIAAA